MPVFQSNLCSFRLYVIITLSAFMLWQSCYRMVDLYSYGMEVVLMKNHFDFKDLMTFGMFLLALLTFVFMFCK